MYNYKLYISSCPAVSFLFSFSNFFSFNTFFLSIERNTSFALVVTDTMDESEILRIGRESEFLSEARTEIFRVKATTGNLEVHPEVCDVSVLLSQAAGEYERTF